MVVVEKDTNQIILKKPKEVKDPPKVFAFDSVFGVESTQRMLYDESAFPLIESVLEGYNGSVTWLSILYRNDICLWANRLR